MLPDPQHLPAELVEGAGDEAVAGPVGGNLLPPEGGILPGLAEMPRACATGLRIAKQALKFVGRRTF
jgi:hypothetical protein